MQHNLKKKALRLRDRSRRKVLGWEIFSFNPQNKKCYYQKAYVIYLLTLPISSHGWQMQWRWGCQDPLNNRAPDLQWQQRPTYIACNILTVQRQYPVANLAGDSLPVRIIKDGGKYKLVSITTSQIIWENEVPRRKTNIYLLICAGNRIKTNVCKEDCCRTSQHTIYSKRKIPVKWGKQKIVK